ncbi:maleylpyruvate isomerase family mycothiol-dependent enzyme [Myceligenerans pegani]|uniref:Maleylpyruvate isomerase family mycothiol-dependent enzyme n=1 Tax=Myceligenerans pegani TaxID=2776917 RepID=A0ABR9N3V7_9MICO|nr:maleylpyruvate isomerase family mycothiol-dependent enzyme [Myceligenerans sp. TRM 65318]MBE1877763.1 maleylpyruvate isomerase family mycothiol-dependent enzyme [Myceligenerans sp. TRM 65318]MBE3020034.1 maleylpyruvate isomerase family mycothiol-dependent enzyme [Myceligenerans sp. TRM 65318]
MTTAGTPNPLGTQPGALDYLALLERLQNAFHASIDDVDPTAAVPTCGGWTVRDLVEHLAQIHHWAAAQARAQRASRLGDGPFELAPHYAAQAAELRETLGRLAPDATARVLSHPKPLAPGPASFWHRRQVYETLIHLHDLRAAAAGHTREDLVADVPPEVWADAVDEVVTVFQPRQVGLGRMRPLTVHVLLGADDAAGTHSWVLGSPDRDRAREVVPDATVTGPARALALLLWGRLTPDQAGVTVEGSRRDLDAVLAEPIVP